MTRGSKPPATCRKKRKNSTLYLYIHIYIFSPRKEKFDQFWFYIRLKITKPYQTVTRPFYYSGGVTTVTNGSYPKRYNENDDWKEILRGR